MSVVENLRPVEDYRVIRKRLWNPPNAVHDPENPMPAGVANVVTAKPQDKGQSDLTFLNFIEGRSNKLALEAAKHVASATLKDRPLFNPLYLHGGIGTGKTHLLHALLDASELTGRYAGASQFMNQFHPGEFRLSIDDVDLLAFDDLQFIHGKVRPAEFGQLLDRMIEMGRQVVIASDRPPFEMADLDERTRSRLAGGLVVEIGEQGDDLRLGIVKARVRSAKEQHSGFDIPDQVLIYIAKVTQNARDIIGAVNRLLAYSTVSGAPMITLEIAERELRDWLRSKEPKRVRIEDIQRLICRRYDISRGDMLSSRRTANVVRPRQIAMYLAKAMTLRSLPEIGRRFGGRDHTTVLHAVRKFEALIADSPTVAEEIDALKAELGGVEP